MINLMAVAQTIVDRTEHLKEQAQEENRDIELSIGLLKEHMPELGELGLNNEVVFIRYCVIEGKVSPVSLKMYVDDKDNQAKLFDAATRPRVVSNVSFVQYETGFNGHQVAQMGEHKVKVALSIPESYRQALLGAKADEAKLKTLIKQGNDTAPIQYLKDLPRATKPLKALQIGVNYQVVEESGKSREYGSKRYLIETPDESQFEVYANRGLQELINQKGVPCKFEVLSIKERKDGKGVTVKVASPDTASLANLTVA